MMSHGVLMEEIFPHVELLYCELRNMNFKLDNKMS